jgi:hypothetical protein
VNSSGVGITKYGSATQRTTIGLAKNMLVWIVFMTVPIRYLDKKVDPPEWKYKVLETFNLLQLFGFLILVVGTILYNEIIVIPFFGFNKYTKEKLAL